MATPIVDPLARKSDPLAGLAVAAVGGALVALGPSDRRAGTLMRLAGLALIGLGAGPLVREQIRRAGARRRSLATHSSIEIGRPVSHVFRFFKDFENFPRVIGAIRAVVDYEDGRSHWEIYAPSGNTIEFDALVTKYVPNSVIAWKSVAGSSVDSSVLIRFTPLSPQSMRLDVDVLYSPAHTDLSDAVRALVAPRATERLQAGLDHARFYLESLPASEPPETPELADAPPAVVAGTSPHGDNTEPRADDSAPRDERHS